MFLVFLCLIVFRFCLFDVLLFKSFGLFYTQCLLRLHTEVACVNYRWGLTQKLRNTKLLNINILQPPDTHTCVCVSGSYSIIMFKSFVLRNFWMNPIFAMLQKMKTFSGSKDSRSGSGVLLSLTGYGISLCRKASVPVFQGIFTSKTAGRIFIAEGWLSERWAIILWSCDVFLVFPGKS